MFKDINGKEIQIGDKVKFVQQLSKFEPDIPLGEIGVVTDIDERDNEELVIRVTYRYKQVNDLDYEWFIPNELEVV